MTDEVEVKDEADWAMMYAEERRLRMKAQRRLASFLRNGSSLAVNADKLVRSILSRTHADQDMVTNIIKTVRDCDDLGADVNLNLFDPVWEMTDKEQEQFGHAECLEDIPKTYRDRTDKLVRKAADVCADEWRAVCERMGFRSPEEVADETRNEISALLEQRIQTDEKRRPKTH